VVGVGYLGHFHVQKYAALEDVELVAVVDTETSRAQEMAARFNTEGVSDYRDILGRVDLVSVVTPPEAHYPVARDCLEAGVHVLVEKPMTETVDQAQHLIDLARERGLVLQVGHLERFNPAVLALRGTLTNPLFIESHRIAPFKLRGTEVSVVMDLMIHDIDIILSLVPSPLTAIRPVGVPVLSDEIDIAHARLEFANGCIANVTASRVSQSAMRKIRLFQHDAYISIDYTENKIGIYRRQPDEAGPGRYRIVAEQKSFEKSDALLMEVRAFVDAVRNGTPPVVSGEDGKRALEVALAIVGTIKNLAQVTAD
jgi:predicted dehydrogenase